MYQTHSADLSIHNGLPGDLSPEAGLPVDVIGPNVELEGLISRLKLSVGTVVVDEIGATDSRNYHPVEDICFLVVLSGKGTLECGPNTVNLRQGTMIIVPANVQISARCSKTTTIMRPTPSGSLIIAASRLNVTAGHGITLFQNLPNLLTVDSGNPTFDAFFACIAIELCQSAFGSEGMVETLLKQAIIIFLRNLVVQGKAAEPFLYMRLSQKVSRVIDMINRAPAVRHTIPRLAREVGMTPLALVSEFERFYAEGLLGYIQGVRIERSSKLLVESNLPVKSIAASVGFASRSHFSRAFRGHRNHCSVSNSKEARTKNTSIMITPPSGLRFV